MPNKYLLHGGGLVAGWLGGWVARWLGGLVAVWRGGWEAANHIRGIQNLAYLHSKITAVHNVTNPIKSQTCSIALQLKG